MDVVKLKTKNESFLNSQHEFRQEPPFNLHKVLIMLFLLEIPLFYTSLTFKNSNQSYFCQEASTNVKK